MNLGSNQEPTIQSCINQVERIYNDYWRADIHRIASLYQKGWTIYHMEPLRLIREVGEGGVKLCSIQAAEEYESGLLNNT